MLTFRLDRPVNTPTTALIPRIPIDAKVVAILTSEERTKYPRPVDVPRGEETAAMAAYYAATDREVCRVDFKTYQDAERVAEAASVFANRPGAYLATDAGPHQHPQYDVVRAFVVGEPVSYAFNGDSYLAGTIVSIGKGTRAKITTSTGKVFYRYKLSGSWRSEGGGTWGLVHGHEEKTNWER